MIENYRSRLIWRLMRTCRYIADGLTLAGFRGGWLHNERGATVAERAREHRRQLPHEAELLANVRPPDWRNPQPTGTYDLVILGAGPAGLLAARGAATLGRKVALIERN